MSSSSKRVCPPGYSINCSARPVRLLLTDLPKVKKSVEGNVQSENRPLQAAALSSDTENLTVDVKEEFDNGEDLSQPEVVKEEFEVEEELFHQQHFRNSCLNSEQKITYDDPVTLKKGDNIILSSLVSPLVPSTRDVHKCLDKLQTLENTRDVGLPEPDLTPTSLSTAAATPDDQTTTFYFPSKIPSSVTLTFDASDEEDDSSQSHEPMPSSSGLQEMGAVSSDFALADKAFTQGPGLNFNVTKLLSAPLMDSGTIMDSKPSTSKVPVEIYELPDEDEESKAEEDISPRLDSNTSLLDEPNVVLPNFIQGPQDTMFLEEVSMTIRQFNELLENIFLYHYFQMPVTKRKIKLEAVLKFLVRGESIAKLSQEYKIAQNTFTKYLPEVLGAIFEVLGLLRVKEGQDPWIETQKRFTERLGLPNCCGVINAKTIITWRKAIYAPRLPVLTLTDADYNILHVDMEAGMEEHGIDFKPTKLYMAIHSTSSTYTLKLPKLGFVVGSEHLLCTSFVLPLYSWVSSDMPIPYLYNKRVERALRVSENTHGILTSKFKIYNKIMTLTPNLAKSVVKTTCALHNWLNQTSPGYITPGLVDVETKEDVALGSWRFAHRQIFQPVPLFHRFSTDRKNPYDTRRDNYAFNLYNLERSHIQH